MKMELRDKDGKFVSSLADDQATLEKLGIQDGTRFIFNYHQFGFVGENEIRAFDWNSKMPNRISCIAATTWVSFQRGWSFPGMKVHVVSTASANIEDVSMVEKYTIPDDKYDEREGYFLKILVIRIKIDTLEL